MEDESRLEVDKDEDLDLDLEDELPQYIKVNDEDILLLKRLIYNTGETTVRGLQKILKVRKEKVRSRMKQLVDEGWLEAPKKNYMGYTIRLSKEEMENLLDS